MKKLDRPEYLKIADDIRASVRNGVTRPGEWLPSTRDLAHERRVHRHTVMRALDELTAEGWLSSTERRGYRVSELLPDSFFEARRDSRARPIARFEWRAKPVEDDLPWSDVEPAQYRFLGGVPDYRLFPIKELNAALRESLRRHPERVLGYGDPRGHGPLLDEIETYLRRARGVQVGSDAGIHRALVLTHGSQEAVFLAAQLLLRPGDVVAVEALGYPPAWRALSAAGAELVPVPLTAEGLDVEAFEKLLKRRRVRLLYITPLHQYPTTVTLPASQRLRVMELAAKYGFGILEDDYDHEYHYRSAPVAPLAASDPGGHVIYVSSFSKTLFPSARIGLAVLPAHLSPAFSALRRMVSRQGETVLHDAVARWMRDGGFERHLRRCRRAYETRRDAMVAALRETRARFSIPDGGMALWVDTGRDSRDFAQRARQLGVEVHPGQRFQSGGRGQVVRHVRMGFAYPSEREIRSGVGLIAPLFT